MTTTAARRRRRRSELPGAGLTGYARVVQRLPHTVRNSVPAGATVLVVSKGDDHLVEIEGREGWHFPRAANGRYAGFHPETGEEAIEHLEELRAEGAGYLVFPSTSLWWLDHYPELAAHLDERYAKVAGDDTCQVYDITGGARPDAAGAVDESRGGAEAVRLRRAVQACVPAGAVVVVASYGDDSLVVFDDHEGRHFPHEHDGTHRGWHPGTDAEAIDWLEQARAAGGEYLMWPPASDWWLGFYTGFAAHLAGRYRAVGQGPAGIVYDLADRGAVSLAESLLPGGAHLVLSTPWAGDATAFRHTFQVDVALADSDPHETGAAIDAAAAAGARYLVLPGAASGWVERNAGVVEALGAELRPVTRQRHAAEVYELVLPAPAPTEAPAAAEAPATAQTPSSTDSKPNTPGTGPARARGPLARLLWGARGERDG